MNKSKVKLNHGQTLVLYLWCEIPKAAGNLVPAAVCRLSKLNASALPSSSSNTISKYRPALLSQHHRPQSSQSTLKLSQASSSPRDTIYKIKLSKWYASLPGLHCKHRADLVLQQSSPFSISMPPPSTLPLNISN